MKQYDDLDRTKSLQRLVPDLYDYKSVLYIGARNDRFDYGEDFKNAGYKIDVLEIWEPNVKYLKTINWINTVIHGDVIGYQALCETYDVIFWWHGPEHIENAILPGIIMYLGLVANKLIVLGCPWGIYDIGALYGNPYERHINHLDHQIFEKFGYEVECLGKINQIGSNITAVKRITDET